MTYWLVNYLFVIPDDVKQNIDKRMRIISQVFSDSDLWNKLLVPSFNIYIYVNVCLAVLIMVFVSDRHLHNLFIF